MQDDSHTLSALHRVIRRLKEEIHKLNHAQAEAQESAVFLGMTAEQNKEYEERRKKVIQLLQHLALLENAQ